MDNRLIEKSFYHSWWFYTMLVVGIFFILAIFIIIWATQQMFEDLKNELTLSLSEITDLSTTSSQSISTSDLGTTNMEVGTAQVPVSADDDAYLGPGEAEIEIIAFADYQCSYCRQQFPVIGELIRLYPDKVKYVFRDFPMLELHAQAQKAAETTECAEEQNKFWQMHDQLFLNQEHLEIDDIKLYALELGLNSEQFNQCLEQGKYQNEVQNDFNQGQALGVTGTPTYFINGQKIPGAIPLKEFKQLIATQLLVQ